MEQDRAFLEAIRDDPDDDLHRLAWADWLDDHGQTRRADFIRAQVRMAALPEDDPARDALEDEADDLLAGHESEWAGRVGMLALEWSWRRGCIERVTLWADDLLTHGEELFASAPIREVRLLTETGDTVRLAGCPLLAYLEALDLGRTSAESFLISAFQRDRSIQQLMISPHWKRLKRLSLRGHGVEGPLLRTLIETGLFARLESLDLSNNQPLGDSAMRLLAAERSNTLSRLDVIGTNLTRSGVRQLMQARSWPALRRLGLNACMLFAQGLTAASIADEWETTPLGSQLTNLCLSTFPMDARAVGALACWKGMSRLEELTLWGCRLDAAAGESLGGTDLSALRSLDLGNNQLRDSGMRALTESPHLKKLTTLRVADSGIGSPGIRAIASSLPGLKELALSGNYVGVAGVEALAAGKLARLRRLDISDSNLNAEAARIVAGSRAFAGLRALHLGNNPLEDEGVAALAASAHLARLRELYLDSCGVNDPGVMALVESPHLTRLTRLGMRNTFISAREREQITVRFGPGVQF